MNYLPYLNREHNYQTCNCISLIAEFYEKELGISFKEEKGIFKDFSVLSIRELRKVKLEDVYSLTNWIKISLTDLQEFDIILYTRQSKLSHFSMYVGNYKILDLVEGKHSVLRHLNDTTRNHIESGLRHRSLAT